MFTLGTWAEGQQKWKLLQSLTSEVRIRRERQQAPTTSPANPPMTGSHLSYL